MNAETLKSHVAFLIRSWERKPDRELTVAELEELHAAVEQLFDYAIGAARPAQAVAQDQWTKGVRA